MRLVGVLLIGAWISAAETPPSAALVRGVLLERDSQIASGQFSVRLPDNQVFRYRFDRKTYVEREQQLVDVPHLKPGEKVEVISDALPGSVLRYARTVHVIYDPPAPRPRSANRLAEERIPAGALSYAGVVFRLSGERLVLHMRDGGEQALLLRKDTRYLRNGEIVDAATLQMNTRVFVRAGKDLWDQIEAYQVIWGNILEP
jgi:hypothetical protein